MKFMVKLSFPKQDGDYKKDIRAIETRRLAGEEVK